MHGQQTFNKDDFKTTNLPVRNLEEEFEHEFCSQSSEGIIVGFILNYRCMYNI